MLVLQAPMTDLLKHWQTQKLLTSLDRHFALELAKIENIALDSPQGNLFLLICALLSRQLSNQHSCLVIDQLALANPMAEDLKPNQTASCQITLSHQALIHEISQFGAIVAITAQIEEQIKDQKKAEEHSATHAPIILDNGNLYLNKYHYFETQVANKLKKLAATRLMSLDDPHIPVFAKHLDNLFGVQSGQEINWQKVATATALTKALAVITGGPGTGKTTTVTKLLLLLLTQGAMTIRLVAPTGKAAARLSESIKDSKARLLTELTHGSTPEQQTLIAALKAIPEEASTLHRLLGVIPNSHRFRHNEDNPLRLSLLVVDEASMVDLPMMHKLLSALPEDARLILLGDQDQLASVEAGAVLADICAGLKQELKQGQALESQKGANQQAWQMRYSQEQAALLGALTQARLNDFISQEPQIGDSLCMLTHSHRFKGDAGIGLLASAVNHADIRAIRQVWQQKHTELTWFEHEKVFINHPQVASMSLAKAPSTTIDEPQTKAAKVKSKAKSTDQMAFSFDFESEDSLEPIDSLEPVNVLEQNQQAAALPSNLHWTIPEVEGKQALLALSVNAYSHYLKLIADNSRIISEQFHRGTTHLDMDEQTPNQLGLHSAKDIIAGFNQYRILSAMRAGEFGVDGMNSAMILCLKQAKLINPAQEFYLGRPVIISSNDYNLGLFNGDIGLILQDEKAPHALMVHFIKADGSILKVQAARLPSHDTCFAMTVHKSQGSEFSQVSFVLPQRPSTAQWQLLSKELLYTAITRAKHAFYCLGSHKVFEKAASQATSRASGLAHRLWGA
jgi:exodeoxyribonuclease V alpha subunit